MATFTPRNDWTDTQETAFSEIQKCSKLDRIQSIQLYRRFKGNLAKALEIAKANYPPVTEKQLANIQKAQKALILKRKQKNRP